MRATVVFAVVLLVACTPRLASADAREDAKKQVGFGILVAQRGLWNEARYRFERAIALDPTYAAAFNNLAITYEQLGLPDRAREAYEKALAIEPRNTMIRQNYELFKEIHERVRKDER